MTSQKLIRESTEDREKRKVEEEKRGGGRKKRKGRVRRKKGRGVGRRRRKMPSSMLGCSLRPPPYASTTHSLELSSLQTCKSGNFHAS